jgi:hypothetical protein
MAALIVNPVAQEALPIKPWYGFTVSMPSVIFHFKDNRSHFVLFVIGYERQHPNRFMAREVAPCPMILCLD